MQGHGGDGHVTGCRPAADEDPLGMACLKWDSRHHRWMPQVEATLATADSAFLQDLQSPVRHLQELNRHHCPAINGPSPSNPRDTGNA
jgi:hypothetical protein